jgi:hypothetical protein
MRSSGIAKRPRSSGVIGRSIGSVSRGSIQQLVSQRCWAPPEHGRWLLAPADPVRQTRRRYREGTLVLETDFETETGMVTVVDCMPPRSREPDVVSLVVGPRGYVSMHMELAIRTDYGAIVPWVRRTESGIRAVAGPDALELYTGVELSGQGLTTSCVGWRASDG